MKSIMKITILIAISPVIANAVDLNCDSTCIVPQANMLVQIPKTQTFTADSTTASPTLPAICGASAGSVLPSAPTSFLCLSGTASTVKTTTKDGEIIYDWICTSPIGTQACMANQREIGVCGLDNGKSLTGNPTNLCNSGEGTTFNLVGNTYSWECKGNYGSPAYCSATYQPPTPPTNCSYHGPTTMGEFNNDFTGNHYDGRPYIIFYLAPPGKLSLIKGFGVYSLFLGSSYVLNGKRYTPGALKMNDGEWSFHELCVK